MLPITLNRCAIILLLAFSICRYSSSQGLYEGSLCTTEHGVAGECRRITDCAARLGDVMAGRRSGNAPGRCGFARNEEIVCCATYIRPADIACNIYQKEAGPRIQPDVIDHTSSMDGKFPYVAALGYRNNDDLAPDPIIYRCGGALISRQYVLTAAQCVRNVEESVPITVRLGIGETHSGGVQEIEIANITTHEKYRLSKVYYDIALVLLKKSVEITNNVRPICLHTEAPKISVSSSSWCGAIGFNDPLLHLLRTPQLPKPAKLQFVPTKTCNEHYTGISPLSNGLDDTLICAVDSNRQASPDACLGDAGTPLITIIDEVQRLLAILSFGLTCDSIVPDVYSSVYPYLDWIEPKVWPDLIEHE